MENQKKLPEIRTLSRSDMDKRIAFLLIKVVQS